MAVRLMGAFAASAGMVRMVRMYDPVFEWVFVSVELRPLRNGTRLVVSLPNAAVVVGAAAAVVGAAAAVVVEPAGDADDDDAGVGVGGCDEELCSPG